MNETIIQAITAIVVAIISGLFGIAVAKIGASSHKSESKKDLIALPEGVKIQRRSRTPFISFVLFAIGGAISVLYLWSFFASSIKAQGFPNITPTETLVVPTNTVLVPKNTPISCSDSLVSRLEVGKYAYVELDTLLNNRVREGAGKDYSIIGYITTGRAMRILDGPKCADGWAWWKVQSIEEPNLVGWTPEGDDFYWLIPCNSLDSCP